jgi:hypothetical protein
MVESPFECLEFKDFNHFKLIFVVPSPVSSVSDSLHVRLSVV